MGRRLFPNLESPVDLFGDAVNGGNRPICLLFPLLSASDRSGDGRSSSVFALPLSPFSLLFPSESFSQKTRSTAILSSLVGNIPSLRNIRRSRQAPPSIKMVNTQSFPPAPKAAAGINSSRYARSRAEIINLINQMRAAGVATELDLPRVTIIVSSTPVCFSYRAALSRLSM